MNCFLIADYGGCQPGIVEDPGGREMVEIDGYFPLATSHVEFGGGS